MRGNRIMYDCTDTVFFQIITEGISFSISNQNREEMIDILFVREQVW